MGEGVKNSPEQLLGQVQLLLHGQAVAAPARGQTVILPALFVVARQKLRGSKQDGTGGEG